MKRIAHNAINRTGENHGHWTIMEYSHTDKFRKRHYRCVCRCGNEKTGNITTILLGKSVSCGCLNAKNHTTHGMSRTRVYRIWKGLISRCNNPNSDKYRWYGGRGITVCKRWVNSFEAFYEDMGEPTTKRHSIDRINTNGNYTPKNCRWATAKQQANNRRTNKPLPQPPKTAQQ